MQSAATVVRYSTGLVTVQKGGELSALRNVEQLEFGGTRRSTSATPEPAIARATIDACGSSGLNLTTDVADYFATVQVNGARATMAAHWTRQPPGTFEYLIGDQVSFKYRAAGDETRPYTSGGPRAKVRRMAW